MLATTGTLRAALDARVRRLRGRLLVDWDRNGYGSTIDDLSAAYSSIEVERELAVDIPQDVKLVAGHVAGKLTAKLATPGQTSAGTRVDPRISPRAYFSPYRTDMPLYGKERRLRPTLAQIQAVTAAAGSPETLAWFTGRTSELLAEGEPTLEVLDGWADALRQIQLPLVLADDRTYSATAQKPRLYADWVVDYIFRRIGYYASPPKRPNSQGSATMHGSLAPETGFLRAGFGANYSKLSFEPEADPASAFNHSAKFVRAVNTDGTTSQVITYELAPGGGPGPNNGQTMVYEGWHRMLSTSRNQPLFIVYQSGAATPFVSAYWQSATGKLQVTVNRGGADTNHSTALTGPTIAPGTSWHYYHFFISFTSTGVNITFRYDSTTTGPVNIATDSFTASGNFDRWGACRGKVDAYADSAFDGLSEAMQVTSETSAGTYNDAFVPTAIIDPSWNELDATPAAERIEAAGLLALIADAELAQIGFTETGIAYFYNRSRWTRSPATVSQKTLSTNLQIEQLPIREAREQVRNKITARTQPPDVLVAKDVWGLPKLKGIGANSIITFLVNTKNPITNLDTTVTATQTGGQSRYQANRNRDGSGTVVTNLTFSIQQIDVNTIKISITNPDVAPAWLVTTTGRNYFFLSADFVQFGEDNTTTSKNFKVESADTTATNASAAEFGEQLLELNPDLSNPFMQDEDSAQVLVDDVALRTAAPKPVLEEFTLSQGDPSLQLGDRVTIQAVQSGVSADFFLTKKRDTLNAEGGFKQTIDGRGA